MPNGLRRESQQHMVRSVAKVALKVGELAVLETLGQAQVGCQSASSSNPQADTTLCLPPQTYFLGAFSFRGLILPLANSTPWPEYTVKPYNSSPPVTWSGL